MVVPVTQEIWAFLREKFGTDEKALCNVLHPCKECQIESEVLKKRQQFEKSTFLKKQDRVLSLSNLDAAEAGYYAVNPSWLKEWELFAQQKTKGFFLLIFYIFRYLYFLNFVSKK